MKPLEAARKFLARGWQPTPIADRSKRPLLPEWQRGGMTPDTLPNFFNGQPQNIGVLLGHVSRNIVDVDIDHAACLELADQFLPPTPAVFGRKSKPRSHRLYRVPSPVPTKKFQGDAGMLVELRSSGCQTVFWGTHESGEPIEWDNPDAEPAAVPSADLLEAVSALADAAKAKMGEPLKLAEKTPKSLSRTKQARGSNAFERARKYLKFVSPAISGRDGHGTTFRAACELFRFGLSDSDAMTLLQEYNTTCVPPWSDRELEHKIESARAKVGRTGEFGSRLEEERDKVRAKLDRAKERTAAIKRGETPAPIEPPATNSEPTAGDITPYGQRDPASGKLVLSPKRIHFTATAYIEEFHGHPDHATIVAYVDQLYAWSRPENRWREAKDAEFNSRLLPWLTESLTYKKIGDELKLVPYEATTQAVHNSRDAIRMTAHIGADKSLPSWLDDRTEPSPRDLLATPDGNLHVPTQTIHAPTPLFFNTTAIDFKYDPQAEPPERWTSFLEQLFGDDLEQMMTLQEWMGYCLVADTSLQKMLLLVGPKRSGKGTIARVLTKLIGAANVAGPTTSGLAGPFGLQPLIGKSLAVVSDARFSGDGIGIVVERLLVITGENAVTIDRKFQLSVTIDLLIRFMFLSNELPKMSDASGALAGRFIVLRLTKSFFGREDPKLTADLYAELPGILLWAIDGLRRLRARGYFVQPASVANAVQEMEDLGSPIGAFVREWCELGSTKEILTSELFEAWKIWCVHQGRDHAGDRARFGRDLRAAAAGVETHQVRRDESVVRIFRGIDLTVETKNQLLADKMEKSAKGGNQ